MKKETVANLAFVALIIFVVGWYMTILKWPELLTKQNVGIVFGSVYSFIIGSWIIVEWKVRKK